MLDCISAFSTSRAGSAGALAGEVVEAFVATVEGARAAGHVGLKSIIAYRTGLAIQETSKAEVVQVFRKVKERARRDGNVRLAFSGRFNNAAEATYADHAYPTPYKYSYQTDLIHENFPTAADLRTVFPAARD